MTLTRALSAARQGDYQQATDYLTSLGGRGSDDPRVLDLLARVHAQQGELGDADDCWARGLELDPALASAVQGRRRIAAMQAKQYRRRPWLLIVAVAGIGALGVLLPKETPSPAPAAPDLSALDRMWDKQAELASELAALRAQLASAAQPSQVIDQIEKGLSSGNFTVVRQRNAVLITFTTGLFNRDARLTAKSAVADLGRQLKPFAGKALIEVTGYTDNRPVPRAFTNDVDLGFARAQAAAAELATAAGIPVAVIGLHSAGSAQPPFPSGTKNNTVTVLVKEAR